MDRSFLLLKPDGVEAGLLDRAVTSVESAGLRILRVRELDLTEAQLFGLYGKYDPRRRPFTAENFKCYFLNRKSAVVLVAGPDAIRRVLRIKAGLRTVWGNTIYANVAHSPDSPEEVDEQWAAVADPGAHLEGSMDPGTDHWGEWTTAEIRAAVCRVWDRIPRGSIAPGALRWNGPQPEAPWRVTARFPSVWTTPFDTIIGELSRWETDGSAYRAVCSAYAALYDADGYTVGAGSRRAAESLAEAVSALGARAEIRQQPLRHRETVPVADGWCSW